MSNSAKETDVPARKGRGSRKNKSASTCDPGKRVLTEHAWDSEGQSDIFLGVLPDKGNILITSHDNPDPDALASCLAVQTLLRKKKKMTPRIAIGGILGRAENRAMCLELDIDLIPIDIVEDKSWDAVIMVDAQPGSGNSTLPPDMPITAVIDHHPRRKPLSVPFIDIRPAYGAVSTILVEFLCKQGVKWDSKLATALFYAIKSETAELGRGICDADRLAYFALFDSVDWEVMHRIIKAKIPGDYFNLFPRGIEAARIYGNAAVCHLGEIPVPDAVAELADFLLRHEDVSRTLVIGLYEDQIVYSIRFTRSDLDAGVVASNIVKGFGAGGGHDLMAGGRIVLKKSNLVRVDEITDILEERFIEAVRMIKHKPGRLLLAEAIEEENR
jgi:nanoRNase/pAp phosphatase (c-di-AMP/oligoRNAs hydrolase)